MADFIQTMKDWRRMCKHYSDESVKDGRTSCVDMCPLGHNTACDIMENALDSDIKVLAEEVAKWAAKHPEPMYPTWLEWLSDMGLIIKNDVGYTFHFIRATQHIPADIAEKLGIEPK